MKRLFTIAFLSLAFFSAFQVFGQAPVCHSVTAGSLTYNQDFNTLSNTGTSSVVPAGFGFAETGTNANLLYTAGTGSSATGDTYSFGSTASTERAFGGIQSGSLLAFVGACFVNNTGSVISSASITYDGEQWRIGALGRLDRLDFQYSTDATSLTTGTWTDVDALDFIAPVTSGSNPLDGNAAANRTAGINSTITSLSVANGATFYIRYFDFNATNSDDGLGIDNFSLTVTVPSPGVISWTEQFPSASESTGVANFTVQRTGGSSGTVMVDVTPSGLGATGGAACTGTVDFVDTPFTLTFNDGETSKPVNIQVCNDALFEGNEVFNMILSNPTNGATLGSPFISQYTILDDDIPSVQMSAAAYSGDEGTNVTVTITRTGATNASADVNYSTSGGTSTAGTCGTAGADYVPQSGTANFGIGVTQISLDIVLCGDLFSENPAETFNFNIDSAISATVGSPATATVTIRDAATQFTNTANILIPSGGNGSIYPSTIAVSGFSTIISGLRVTLAGLTHTSPDDLRVLLVSPTGQSMVIMSGTGGLNDLNDTTITFEDFAASGLPDNTAISNGQNYKPTGCGTIDPFPAPAPGSGYALPGCPPPVSPGGAPTLATTFGGFNPNGNWSLYLVDSGLNPVAAGGNSLSGWGLQFFGPTAANVSLNGRVMTANGQGIRDAVVTIDGGGLSAPRRMRTVTFGYFRFDDLSSGQTYIVTVNSRRYAFAVPTRLVTLEDNVSDFDFAAEPRD